MKLVTDAARDRFQKHLEIAIGALWRDLESLAARDQLDALGPVRMRMADARAALEQASTDLATAQRAVQDARDQLAAALLSGDKSLIDQAGLDYQAAEAKLGQTFPEQGAVPVAPSAAATG